MFFGYTTIALALTGIGVADLEVAPGHARPRVRGPRRLRGRADRDELLGVDAAEGACRRVRRVLLYTTVAIAAVTWGRTLLDRRLNAARVATAVGLFSGALAVSLFWITVPSNIRNGDFEVPTLSYFLREATTLYRVYSRFGVLVGLGLILLAAYALANVPRRPLYTALTVVPIAIVAFELSIGQPKFLRVQDIHTPTTVAELAELASGPQDVVT